MTMTAVTPFHSRQNPPLPKNWEQLFAAVLSDARMSGTAFGTVVLHVAPESAIGGPLALVKTGDMIILDTAARKLELDVPAEEIERRRKAFVPPKPAFERGYGKLYIDHVTQADKGVDFDFLKGSSGTPPSKFSF